MNRLEMSQYLQIGPLGKVNQANVKLLKCPNSPKASVSLTIAIVEQVFELLRPSLQPYTDESSS